MGPFLLLRERGEAVDRLLVVAEAEPVPLILNRGIETRYYYWRDLIFELVGPLERPVDAALCAAAVTGTISEGDPLDLTAISRAIYERDRGLATPPLADEAVAEPVRIRRPIARDVKMFVWQRDGGRCVECGSNERLEFDHIIPWADGGSDTARNLQLLCETCNRRKGRNL